MSPTEIADLRRCAVHEAGHAVACEQLTGHPASIEIQRHARNGAVWFKGQASHPGVEPEAQMMISLAGPIAEVMDSAKRLNSGDALLSPTLACMSAADARGAGQFSRADLNRCLALVVSHWPAIDARARHEAQRWRLTQGALA